MYIDKNWYNKEEMSEFMKKMPLANINEAASVQTRIRLARAARRTAKRRNFIRKLKEKKRKQSGDLKKRAYSEVRNAFRKKLYKGKWSSLPYSARQRIDGVIQKRKPLINRMVQRIMPRVTRKETTRLQKLSKKNKSR